MTVSAPFFPRVLCRQKGIAPNLCDSIVNKTPISAKANRMIGDKAPSKYLERIQNQAGIENEEIIAKAMGKEINYDD